MPNTFKQITLLPGQNLYDIAVQEYGHTEGIWLIIDDNPGLIGDLSHIPEAGKMVNIRTEVPELGAENVAVAAHFARRGYKVVSGSEATAFTTTSYVEDDYWDSNYTENQVII